jgi:hypothetical protein
VEPQASTGRSAAEEAAVAASSSVLARPLTLVLEGPAKERPYPSCGESSSVDGEAPRRYARVVNEAVDHRGGGDLVAEDVAARRERLVAGHDHAARS